jgi:N-acyl amino acid synthase of PEP-CTERM/exosortase system
MLNTDKRGIFYSDTPNNEVTTFQDRKFSPEPLRYSLHTLYNSLFETAIALTAADTVTAYRVRYQAYCLDNTFENPADYPNGLESDAFDHRSVHALLHHGPTGTVVGTVRLILPDGSIQSEPLPMVQTTGLVSQDVPLPFPSTTTAEVSRFAIPRAFRTSAACLTLSPEIRRSVLAHLPLGLIRGLVAMSAAQGITHWCAMMEPALLRLLGRYGIHFRALGPLVDHHGWRQPCWIAVRPMLQQVYADRRDVWEVITDRGESLPAVQ